MNFRLWEQIRDWVLLFVLLLISVFTMYMQNEPLVRAMKARSLEVTAQVESGFAWMGRYVRALEENSELRQRNVELSSEVARAREVRERVKELERMLGLKNSDQYDLQPARIVTKDVTKQHNFITLDVGRKDNVEVGMPVVNDQGILGKVVFVSAHFSQVMPYLNTDFRVPAKVLPLQAEGIVGWEGERLDQMLMEHVIKTEQVKPGQLVVTSGHSGVYPPGLSIGRVDSVKVRPGRNELMIYLSPAARMNGINHAFVILSKPDPERVSLEERTQS